MAVVGAAAFWQVLPSGAPAEDWLLATSQGLPDGVRRGGSGAPVAAVVVGDGQAAKIVGDRGHGQGQGGFGFSIKHPDRAAETYTSNAALFKAKVAGLLPGVTLVWAPKAFLPTLMPESILLLRPLVDPRYAGPILDPLVGITDLERAEGAMVLDFDGSVPSVEELSSWFLGEAMPAGKKADTRRGNDNTWRGYVTFALAIGKIKEAFPVRRDMLSAYVTVLIAFGYTGDTIQTILSAIVGRQRTYGGPPILGFKETTEWCRGLRKYLKKARPKKYPLRPIHLRLIAELQEHKGYVLMSQFAHDKFLVTLGTQGAMRIGELPLRDLCDWKVGSERGDSGEALGAILNVGFQKNGQPPMLKRFAFGAVRTRCVIAMGNEWIRIAGLQTHPECRKWALDGDRSAPCKLCGKLFRKFNNHGPQLRGAHSTSKSAVSTAITKLLTCINEDPTAYQGKSLRKGGLTAAKKAGIPEELRRKQSGHTSAANRIYEKGMTSEEEDVEDAVVAPPIQKPLGGWSLADLYRFSKVFH